MKVFQLISLLNKVDPHLDVVISMDEEGNGYRLLYEDNIAYGNNAYDQDLEVGLQHLTPELEDDGYTEEDVIENGTPCIIFY